MSFVSKSIDTYVNVYGDNHPMWIAKLSNGETVYQDDDRPEVHPASAWLRLRDYCIQEKIHVKSLLLKNKSNQVVAIQDDENDGVFLTKAAGAFLFGDETLEFFNVGVIKNGKAHLTKWKMPDMTRDLREEREAEQYVDVSILRAGNFGKELQT
jgi:hypothetical protein